MAEATARPGLVVTSTLDCYQAESASLPLGALLCVALCVARVSRSRVLIIHDRPKSATEDILVEFSKEIRKEII